VLRSPKGEISLLQVWKARQVVNGISHLFKNPFSAEQIRPGSLPFFFPPGRTPESLWERFCRLGGQAQILGKHGSGKTSLILALLAASPWQQVHGRVICVRDRQPRTLAALKEISDLRAGGLVVVDGFEQWLPLGQMCVIFYTRLKTLKLLVTGHKHNFLPVLIELRPDWRLASQLVGLLLREAAEERRAQGLPPVLIPEAIVYKVFHDCHGNLREMFFRLYDIYEESLRGSDGPSG
jgi:hypothetical protein